MENSQNIQEENLEKTFSGGQNFFFDKISEFLTKGIEDGSIEKTINDLYTGDLGERKLTVLEFQTIGSFAYLVGIDYTSQQYLMEKVCLNVAKRFSKFNFGPELLYRFAVIISNLKEENLLDALTEMKSKFAEKVTFINPVEKQSFLIARGIAKNVISNSNIPINMVVGIDEVVENKNTTYQDILKFNSIINKQCKYNGSGAVKNVLKLYNDKTFRKVLDIASEYFDMQKFAAIYLDSILSINDANKRMDISFDILHHVIAVDALHPDFFEQFKADWDAKQKEIESSKEEIPEVEAFDKYQGLSEKDTQVLMDENPTRFVFEVLCDMLKKKITTPEEALEAIDILVNDIEAGQHIYTFLKLSKDKINVNSDMGFSDNKEIEIIAKTLDIQFREKQISLKSMIEKICEPLPDDISNRIVTYVNLCIEDLILADDKQKQYLLSQLIENQIHTYNQLQQIISMIETCDIPGKVMDSYVVLHKYLKNNNTLVDIFETAEKQEEAQTKITILKAFVDYYNAYLASFILSNEK